MELVIGSRNYSSWSLRAWLYLRESGLDFDLTRIPMFCDDWDERVRSYSPAGRVPVLIDGEVRVWDSFAIVQHVGEKYPAAVGWPEDERARAQARSVSAEMHSGFVALRGELPQNLKRRSSPPEISALCGTQVNRVHEIIASARAEFGDERGWLFGDFSIADVFYVPTVLRFVTYGLELPQATSEFVAAVQALESVREWCALAEREDEAIDFIDDLVPADEAPLVLG